MIRRLIPLAALPLLAACGASDPHAEGKEIYAQFCAGCHGADLEGNMGANGPNLKDGIWLFGSDDLDVPYGVMRVEDLARTIRHGIHSDDPEGRNAVVMPGLGHRLTDEEIIDVTEWVLSYSGQALDETRAARGQIVYDDEGECFDCHGWNGQGDGAIGSTDFTRNLWLWGSDRATIMASIRNGRVGVCPGFKDKLSEPQITAVAAYVLSRNPSPGPK